MSKIKDDIAKLLEPSTEENSLKKVRRIERAGHIVSLIANNLPDMSEEEILELAKKVKGDWVTDEWLKGEGADFKAGLLNGFEAYQDKLKKEMEG